MGFKLVCLLRASWKGAESSITEVRISSESLSKVMRSSVRVEQKRTQAGL